MSRKISHFFKPPDFSLPNRDPSSDSREDRTAPPLSFSSPLTERRANNASSPQTPNAAGSQLEASLLRSLSEEAESQTSRDPLKSGQYVQSASSDAASSFNSTQRVVKNGKEVVISSDGEDTDSIASLEAPDTLLMQLATPSNANETETAIENKSTSNISRRSRPSKEKSSKTRAPPPTYRNTLDSLVVEAVDDNETETKIAKFKAAQNEKSRNSSGPNWAQKGQLSEGILTSAFGDQDGEGSLQRLLDAVRRTEAFDLEKAWFFFDYGNNMAPPLEFPRDSFYPDTYMSVLREPDSRERAFFSGIVDVALSRGRLPDELITWLFNTVPSEPRDSLRHSYCRALKSTRADSIRSLIRPSHIDTLFQRLGATPKALAVCEEVTPDALPKHNILRGDAQHRSSLLSILDLFSGASNSFATDTRKHILSLLFRLTLDISLTSNVTICSGIERAISAILDSISRDDDSADDCKQQLCMPAYDTIKDPVFQSRMIRHILPTSSWIADLRARLALAFLTGDAEPLNDTADTMTCMRRITEVLKDRRFNMKRYKGKAEADYDYGELAATTTLLNVVIDSGWSGLDFPSKDAERDFNTEVDTLADRIKKIFTSIEDSGASHLKRTLAKEGLEALHYRIVYSVRSKPRPKKSLFGPREERQPSVHTWFSTVPGGTRIPFRGHEEG
ncbi:hypothetical protein BDV59DRAFT_204184 [Aspergillus ambiguus]|uniref:uncharacterized protein n=1 Tax=Aspergillus ambiguus TaxID=176160 RepID=UPI003CCD5563